MRKKKWFDFKKIGVRADIDVANLYFKILDKEKITVQDDLYNYITNKAAIHLLVDADSRTNNLNNQKVPALTRKKMERLKVEDVL